MSDALATVIIPIAPAHAVLAQTAIASVRQQTVPCAVLPQIDEQGIGAGAMRNRGLAQVQTEFVVFLDADDWLLPTFVERCWALFQQTRKYIYTDFLDDAGHLHRAPDCAWMLDSGVPAQTDPMRAAHAITTLLPTTWARTVGGFDETLSGGEDSEFYIHLVTEGYCGTRLPEALFVYRDSLNSRSKRWKAVGGVAHLEQLVRERYTEKGKIVGCCTEPATRREEIEQARMGFVLARPRWGGNRHERGRVTGNLYGPCDHFTVVEIDPRDAEARPDHWEVLARPTPPSIPVAAPIPPIPPMPATPITPTPKLATLGQYALQLPPPPPVPPPAAPVVPSAPDVSRIVRIAQQKTVSVGEKGAWVRDGSDSAEYLVPGNPQYPVVRNDAPEPFTQDGQHSRAEARQAIQNTRDLVERSYSVPTIRHTTDPVFVFPDQDYPSYTDVRRLVELSGFEWRRMSDGGYTPDQRFILLSPEQPPLQLTETHQYIWWSLEYGGEYEPDLTNWRGDVWASDPTWAKAHGAKFVVMGSHEGLRSGVSRSEGAFDLTMLAYMTPRRQLVRDQLADLRWPSEIYPGYGANRDAQLVNSKLMLHVHQRDDVRAIAPQRIALAAAYQLPLICESVPDAGDYGKWIPFVNYEYLNGEVRSQLAMFDEGLPQARAEMLHTWLCKELTFRPCVEEALKS